MLSPTMKAEHEARIAVVAGIDEDRASHVIGFGASICDNEALVSTQAIFSSMPLNVIPPTARPSTSRWWDAPFAMTSPPIGRFNERI